MSNVLRFPTARRRAYPQPALANWWKNPAFADVPRVHHLLARPDDPPPVRPLQMLALELALLSAIRRRDPELFKLVRDAVERGLQKHPNDPSFLDARFILNTIDS
jgi:hypothetical protein